jgi:hypothetical protein
VPPDLVRCFLLNGLRRPPRAVSLLPCESARSHRTACRRPARRCPARRRSARCCPPQLFLLAHGSCTPMPLLRAPPAAGPAPRARLPTPVLPPPWPASTATWSPHAYAPARHRCLPRGKKPWALPSLADSPKPTLPQREACRRRSSTRAHAPTRRCCWPTSALPPGGARATCRSGLSAPERLFQRLPALRSTRALSNAASHSPAPRLPSTARLCSGCPACLRLPCSCRAHSGAAARLRRAEPPLLAPLRHPPAQRSRRPSPRAPASTAPRLCPRSSSRAPPPSTAPAHAPGPACAVRSPSPSRVAPLPPEPSRREPASLQHRAMRIHARPPPCARLSWVEERKGHERERDDTTSGRRRKSNTKTTEREGELGFPKDLCINLENCRDLSVKYKFSINLKPE